MQVRIVKKDGKYKHGEYINALPFGQVSTVNFKNQLNGSGKELVTLGRICEKLGGFTLVGAETDNCGIRKKSVFVFEGARLLSICDMNRQEEKYAPSFGYKIFDFAGKKFGVVVDRDLFTPSCISSMVSCGVGAIISLYEGILTKKVACACEFYAYVYGVDIVCVSLENGVAFDAYGEQKQFENNQVSLNFEGVYREVKIKRRGI